jgi:PAS domain S-box-containing protein
VPDFLQSTTSPTVQFGWDTALDILYEDEDVSHYRTSTTDENGNVTPLLVVRPKSGTPNIATFERLVNEYRLRGKLDRAWAVQPLELRRQTDRAVLLLRDTGGHPLEHHLNAPLPLHQFLQLAIQTAAAVGQMHACNIVHKDLKPAHLYVDEFNDAVRLTGFGLASEIPAHHDPTCPPEVIAGTMAYMAPEQTGRLNRSVDTRSDLYSLGIVFYRMLTGKLPFSANSTMGWIHSHTSRKPIPPDACSSSVAPQLSAIVMKLLEKEPEDRYQSAAGLESDLRRCKADWSTRGAIRPFALGDADLPDGLTGPNRLYGRQREIARLMVAFERTSGGAAPELVLVSGYSGVGKSSLVHELQRLIGPSQGIFAGGKCDQQKIDMPYAALAFALKSLVKQLLTRHEGDVATWCTAIRDALGPNAKLIIDLVPELALLIGDQPPAPELPLPQAQSRFKLVLRRFIQVFARADAPLVLFVDDLQWGDTATLDLIADIAGRSEMRHVLLIGAYRDNEVGASHPLAIKVAAARAAGAAVELIKLAPLAAGEVVSLVGDLLRSDDKLVEPLAKVVHLKTAGNPFFTIQFLRTLAEENVLVMDSAARRWSWDIRPIQRIGYTDNVAELMVARLKRLPPDCSDVLRELACLGNSATSHSLAIVHQATEAAIHDQLRIAVQQELVERTGDTYRFSHDRVQEAAYSLTPDSTRVETHLRIGRLLLPHLPNDDGLVFEVAGQFNRALDRITSNEEREAVARLNLRAGTRAKLSAAYDGALRYLSSSAELLEQEPWDRWSDIRFWLELELAECEFLTGKLAASERRLAALSTRTTDVIAKGRVTCSQMDVYTALDQSDRAISVAIEYFRHVGISWSAHPSDHEVQDEYAELRRRMAGLTVENIVDLPPMTDSVTLTTVEVLTRLLSASCFTDFNLNSLIACKAINLSLEAGNCEASCVAYGTLSRISGPRFGDFEAGIRFGKAGYKIAERNPQHRFHASTCMVFSIFTMRWIKHVRLSEAMLRRTFATASKAGDLLYASYSLCCLNTNFLFAGDAIQDIRSEIERGLAFTQRAQHGLAIAIISTQLAFARSLQGQTRLFGSFNSANFEEHEFESHLAGSPTLALAECWYWIRKIQARYLAGDYQMAAQSLPKVQSLIWTSSMFLEEAEFHFYAALTLAATLGHASADQRADHIGRIAHHDAKLSVLANNFPENFENRAALVSAEIARLEGRTLDAERLYELAIQSARSNNFPHQEALASELAAYFYRGRGFEIIANAYLRNARYGYLRWGALAKIRQLDDMNPHLGADEHGSGAGSSIRSQAGDFDFGMLIDVSQRISSEIVLEKVIDTFLQAALTHAGADRGLLILSSTEGGPRIEAEATVYKDSVLVEQESISIDDSRLSMTIINYVLRTRETVLVSDAASDPVFGADPYTSALGVRATLCIPLMRRGELTGALYLENKLTPGTFAAPRQAALKVLASQVAITLENARLYRELSDREARIRRLVDANIIGIFIFSLSGMLLEANAAFLDLVGYNRNELERGQLNWKDLTPADWLDIDFQMHEPVLRSTGVLAPIEKEYFRKDGSRVPVLVGAAMFSPASNEGVAFILDLSESKRTEAESRENEIRFREMQHELAHANRVSTVGQLTATISHEVKQPIAAMAASADAGLRWLSMQPANVEKARGALDYIVRDAMRAGDIIDRIRNLVRKAPTRQETVDVNAAILEVLFMTRRDAEKNGVSIETNLAALSPLVVGDRVQLQQVVLNLVVNAIEAMSAVNEGRRTLRVATSLGDGGEVDIKVSDSGPGVSEAHMDRLFEPFFTTKDTGMGIGLSVAHSVVLAHGGRLQVTSSNHSGTTFHVSLPPAAE